MRAAADPCAHELMQAGDGVAAGLDMARAEDLVLIFALKSDRAWKQIIGYRQDSAVVQGES